MEDGAAAGSGAAGAVGGGTCIVEDGAAAGAAFGAIFSLGMAAAVALRFGFGGGGCAGCVAAAGAAGAASAGAWDVVIFSFGMAELVMRIFGGSFTDGAAASGCCGGGCGGICGFKFAAGSGDAEVSGILRCPPS